MEGVGARLGRSSSRYGATTVFNGPVRKWKKDWVPIPPSSSNNSNHHHHHNNNNNHHHSSSNGNVNGSNGNSASHLRLYKWTPLNKETSSNDNNSNTSSSNNNKVSSSNIDDSNGNKDSGKDDVVSEEPRKKKFKYFPVTFFKKFLCLVLFALLNIFGSRFFFLFNGDLIRYIWFVFG